MIDHDCTNMPSNNLFSNDNHKCNNYTMSELTEISGNTTSITTASVSGVCDVPPSKASSSTSSSFSSSNLLIFPAILLNEDSVNPDGKAEAFFKSVLSHAIRGGGFAGWYH